MVFSGVRAGGGELPVKIEHGLHKAAQAVVAGDVGGMVEIDGSIQKILLCFTYHKLDHDDRSFETLSDSHQL
jgi:hypothetical protein